MRHMNDPQHPETYGRRILVAVTGLSPQVVTETIYALSVRAKPAFVPTEIHLITTGKGADNARLNLLSSRISWFHRLRHDWNLPPMAFDADNIHVIPAGDGTPLEDIRDGEDNTRAADFITGHIARLTKEPDSALHVSLAGGRKTMGYYLGYALSLFGREQDRLSHVLVAAPFENHRDFYYPTPLEYPIHVLEDGKDIAYDCRTAEVELAEIPFVRLRDGLPRDLLTGGASFSRVVSAAQMASRQLALVLDTGSQTARAGGESLNLTPQAFVLLLWFARRRKAGQEAVSCGQRENLAAGRELIALTREIYGQNSAQAEATEKALRDGMRSEWFSPAKTRLNRSLAKALGERGAVPYQIKGEGRRNAMCFSLALNPEYIHFHEDTP